MALSCRTQTSSLEITSMFINFVTLCSADLGAKLVSVETLPAGTLEALRKELIVNYSIYISPGREGDRFGKTGCVGIVDNC